MAPTVRILRFEKIACLKRNRYLYQKSQFARNLPSRLIPIFCEKLGKQGLGMGHRATSFLQKVEVRVGLHLPLENGHTLRNYTRTVILASKPLI